MSLMDKFINAMSLNEEDDDEYYNDEYYDDEEEENRASFFRREKKESAEPEKPVVKEAPVRKTGTTERPKSTSKITPISRSRKQGEQMEVCLFKPQSIDEEREITDTLLNGRAVVINMEGVDLNVAQRIIDFTAGSTYAMRGNLRMISKYIFLATPQNVDISGDFKEYFDLE